MRKVAVDLEGQAKGDYAFLRNIAAVAERRETA